MVTVSTTKDGLPLIPHQSFFVSSEAVRKICISRFASPASLVERIDIDGKGVAYRPDREKNGGRRFSGWMGRARP